MKLIFIDANVFLDLYRGKVAQLEVLESFPTLIVEKGYKIYLTDHLVNEVHRNREIVVKDQLVGFEKYKVNNSFSNIIRSLDIYNELKNQTNQYNLVVERGLTEIKEKINRKALRADSLLKEIINKSVVITTNEADRKKARDRYDFGFPPGKDKSYGDALNWNVLIEDVNIIEKDLYLVTRDGDFSSCLDKKQPNPYLEDEWHKVRGGKIKILDSIADLVSQLEQDDVEYKNLRRNELLDELRESSSFSQTHDLIAKLRPLINEFTVENLKKFFYAYYSNGQINMIGNDADIIAFKELINRHPLYTQELRETILQEILGTE